MLQRFSLGVLVFVASAGIVAGCGGGLAQSQCLAQAVALLPRNVDDIDVGVARELGRRIHACEQQGDAGR